ncbi:hypothetical protein F383_32409 [Gossypium arboreum]|uniref:Uncharacterized protein n=1 Tax=Gossypium arboreum TaxID=29729 RepID=A0A0B0MZB6_GOSAR|nr:hypothetical protein F383_32409 [Gossypium arboreum]
MSKYEQVSTKLTLGLLRYVI